MKNALLIFFTLLSLFCSSQKREKLTVYFKFNEYSLDSASRNKIDSAIQNKTIETVYIEAHCDSFGTDQYNDALSLKRALEIKHYLLSKKLNEALIDLKARGKRLPLNKNEDEKARSLNRRAEIELVTTDSSRVSKTERILQDSTVVFSTNDHFGLPQQINSPHRSDSLPQSISTFDINKTEVGSSLLLENMNFYGGRHELLPRAAKTLKLLLDTLNKYPTLEIEIQGHICCQYGWGDGFDFDTHTYDLSVNRAKAVYDYLIKKGIDRSRLSYKGFGATRKLIEQDFTEKDMETNRRVEIKIIKK